MLRFVFSAVFTLFTTTSVGAEDTVVWEKDIQGWSVIVDRTISDSCFMISEVSDDLYLRLQFNSIQSNVQLIVANMRWDALENGRDYDLEVAFGKHSAWTGPANGYLWHDVLPSLVFSVPFANQQAQYFLREFEETNSVRISFNGTEIAKADLGRSDEALAALAACQSTLSDIDGGLLQARL